MVETPGPGNPSGKRSGRQPPWDKSGEPEAASFGTWLRRQRELREISLRDVAERTKISLRYLEAMEEDRFDLLPAPVFAKGFLREYARYVGLSPDEVVNHWLAVQQAGERPEGDDENTEAGGPGRRRLWIVILLLLLLLAALAGFGLYWQRHHPLAGRPARAAAAPPAVPTSPAPPASSAPGETAVGGPAVAPAARPAASRSAAALPPPSPAETQSEAPPSPLEVTLDFSRECWVEALIDGKKRIAEQRVAGEALRIPAQQKVQLTLGDAGAAEVQVNGSPLALPVTGKGQVLRDFNIDLDTLKTLKAKKETH